MDVVQLQDYLDYRPSVDLVMYGHNLLDIARMEKWADMDKIEHRGVTDIAPAVALRTSMSRITEACAGENSGSTAVADHFCAPSICKCVLGQTTVASYERVLRSGSSR